MAVPLIILVDKLKLPSRTLLNLATAKALQSLLRKKQRKSHRNLPDLKTATFSTPAAESAVSACTLDSKKHAQLSFPPIPWEMVKNSLKDSYEILHFRFTKQDQLLEIILCYNLSIPYLRRLRFLEDLKSWEAEGVKILTCTAWICLKEKLAAQALICNEIVELWKAGTIVRP